MTFEEMKQIEPALGTLERDLIARNEDAKDTEIYWSDVWVDIKPALINCVGMEGNGKIELSEPEHWDTALHHFESLVTNMK